MRHRLIIAATACIGGLTMYAVACTSDNDKKYRAVYFGEPLPNLAKNELATFDSGFQIFIKVWKEKDGLGPFFNAHSCSNCHHIPVVGGTETALDKFVIHSVDIIDPAGQHSFQRFKAHGGSIEKMTLPVNPSYRKTQPLYGLGLLESIPDFQLLELCDSMDTDNDGISGRLPIFNGHYGRFGWKSNAANIREFVALALVTEIGLSNEVYDDDSSKGPGQLEVSKVQLDYLTDFLKLLAAPPRKQPSQRPISAFINAECSKCHKPSFTTANQRHLSLNNVSISPYTDLLLHNMGNTLSDMQEGRADPDEFRTPALWGINSSGPPFLHDGRARTLEDAILLHGGEATSSVNKFKALSKSQQGEIINFIKSL